MRNKIQVNVRLDPAYVATLKKLGNQATHIQHGLDLIPDTRFKRELKKNKEAYGRTKVRANKGQEGHPSSEAIRNEFTN